jgi:hypothetical protein
VAAETDNTARIKKAYLLIFGRAPSDVEIRTGLAFLATEPLKEYEERKTARDTKDAKDSKSAKDTKDTKNDAADDDEGSEKVGEGMMAGVIPGASKKGSDEKLLPPTPWGRYVKILLSSSEFLFVD